MFLRSVLIISLAALCTILGCMGFGEVDPREVILIDYESHVRPLIEKRCANCHGDPPIGGSITITDEASTIQHAERIHARAVIMGDMPPGLPLTTTEKRILDTWIRSVVLTMGGNEGGAEGITGGSAGMNGEDDPITWNDNIGPLFELTCVACHSETASQSGLDLSTYEGISVGGDQGALIDTNDITQSLLIDYLRGQNDKLQMPPGSALSESEIQQVEIWLSEGAQEGVQP
jgi:uncharacterized membrane protein